MFLRLSPLLLAAACTGSADSATTGGDGALVFTGNPPRRLLLISIDTLRRDAIGRYAGDADATPTLDRLLEEGLPLDDHISCSAWTFPSMLCALSGRSTTDVGFEPLHDPAGEPVPMPDGLVDLLADHLGRAGFDAGLVSTNPFLHDAFHTASGYRQKVMDPTLDAAQVVDAGLGLLDAMERDRWLLHLHFIDPHAPYDPPAEYLDGLDALPPIDVDLTSYPEVEALADSFQDLSPEVLSAIEAHARLRYAGLARYVDDQLARLFGELDARGTLDGTLVLLMTDHGEQFWDHGDLGHGTMLYAEENAALAAFWGAGLEPGVWSGPTTHADLMPTLLAALDVDASPPTTGEVVGCADDDRPRLTQIYQREETRQAVIQGGDKLLFDWRGVWSLHLGEDGPAESVDRFTERPDRAAALWALMASETDALEALYPDYTADRASAP